MKYSGVEIKAATKRIPEPTSSYAGANASSPTLLCPLISEDVKRLVEHDEATGLAGQAARGEAEVIREVVGGSISTEAWFNGLEYLFLSAFGYENPSVYAGNYGSGSGGSPAPDSGTPSAYYHLFELDDDLSVRPWSAGERNASSGTDPDPEYWTGADRVHRDFDLGIDKDEAGGLVRRFNGCMVTDMQLNIAGDKVSLDWSLIGKTSDTNAMNHDNWTALSQHRAVFAGARMYLGTYSAGSWTYSANEYGIAEMQLKLENGLRRDFVSGADSKYTLEPIREGFRKVSGQVKMARIDSTGSVVLDSYAATGLSVCIMVELVGPEIVAGHNYRMRFMIPAATLRGYQAPVAGPGVIQPSFDFTAYKPPTTPTWVETLAGGVAITKDNEMLCQLVNDQPASFGRDRQASGVTLP